MPVYNYTTLDDPSSVGFTTAGAGINSAGQVVGFYNSHGFFYNSGAYVNIDDPLATQYTRALGINATDLIVGTYHNTTNHGFIFNPSTGTYSIIDPPGSTNAWANGINDPGQIVGQYVDGGNKQHGFLLN